MLLHRNSGLSWRVPFCLVTAALLPGLTFAGGQARPTDKKGAGHVLPDSRESSSRLAAKNGKTTPETSSSAKPKDAGDADANKYGYRVGVEDELQISVWREPELSQMVVVRPDGMITLPLLNDVNVTGLKTDELAAFLAERLKPFVNEPQVTVIVRAVRSRKVYLAGQVARQGAFPLGGKKTVLELIVEAGGLGAFAKSNSIYILRNQGGKQIRIPFSYKKAILGRAENIELTPGDMVVVP